MPAMLRRLRPPSPTRFRRRSEEHTSELQSLRHLVCRLLLEKKKPETPDTIWRPQRNYHKRTSLRSRISLGASASPPAGGSASDPTPLPTTRITSDTSPQHTT